MELHTRCFKIDKSNGKAMIAGYFSDGRRIRQSIWCAVMPGDFPALVTLNRTATKFELSPLGEHLDSDTYSIPYKYIATLSAQYFIRNDIRLWERICNNGLFDIWNPCAPERRFNNSKLYKSDPCCARIQLIRLYEIHEQFALDQVRNKSDRIDHLVAPNRNVTIVRPIIEDHEFVDLKQPLESSVADFRVPSRWG